MDAKSLSGDGSLIVGLNGWDSNSHNASVTLVNARKDELLVEFAIEEERISRDKQAFDTFPDRALSTTLHRYSLSPREVDFFVFGWRAPSRWNADREAQLSTQLFGDPHLLKGKLKFIDHHRAHAACTFRTSPFTKALVLVLDGSGDGESGSVWIAADDNLTKVLSIPVDSSLGFLFEAVNLTVGFDSLESGKTMGLAAFGQPVHRNALMDCFHPDAPLEINREVIGRFASLAARSVRAAHPNARDQHAAVLMWRLFFRDRLGIGELGPRPRSFGDMASDYRNLAASVQAVVQDLAARLVQSMIDRYEIADICISGGVGLNCTMNGHVLANTSATGLFVNPAANDAGVSMGAALELTRELNLPGPHQVAHFSPFLGMEYSTGEIADVLATRGVDFVQVECAAERLSASVAGQGQTVGLFQGREEWGPRALGNRTIISWPRDPERRDYINKYIKDRELGRPLAPSLLAEDLASAADCWKAGACLDFMNVALGSGVQARESIPAVIHADGSFRPQIVRKKTNETYAEQLKMMRENHGSSIVLNTSFNVSTPIVHTVDDALDAFVQTPLDQIVFNNQLIVSKPR